ncbi:MAG TPA: zf-HC2 domain-containing protein [Actinomycetota bacterium]|nr:zf-HC2 domain-containing protein [Actinomycetota bacterium]
MTEAAEITCREMVELMTDYLEEAMSPETRGRFEEHLAACDGCTNYLGQLREAIRATGTLTEEQIPAHQKDELLQAFRDWHRSG